jgi:UDP-glucose 4-epimerase
MQKILVTGGTGYIGSHTVVELQQAGYEIVIIDNLSNSNAGVLDGITDITGKKPYFYNLDCLDKEKLSQAFAAHPEIKGIIHFAASKAVGESLEKPLLYYRNNLVSLLNILDLMPQYGIENLVFSSSCTVYGQPDVLPVNENSPIKEALSPYGNTKQICEEIIRDTIAASAVRLRSQTESPTSSDSAGAGLKSIILRYFNPIGAHPSALIGELPNGVPQNLIPFITQTAIGIRKELSVFGDDYNTPDGSCIRDYINVVDLAKAHVAAFERMINGKNKAGLEYFNIGTGNGLSVLELIKAFEKATGVKVPYKIAPRRAGDIEKVWADASLANKELGWTAKETIEDTLKSAWNWELKLSERRKDK